MRPVLQFQLGDVREHLGLAEQRFSELHRLGIKVCLVHYDDERDARRLVERLRISLVRLSFRTVREGDPTRLGALVARLKAAGAGVIAAGIENPQTIAQLWGCGVDFVQGNFLQFPATELKFDFSETALD